MDSIRNKLTATAAGGLLTAASVAAAQTVEGIPQPRRPLQQFAPRLRSRLSTAAYDDRWSTPSSGSYS
jgi:Phage related protein